MMENERVKAEEVKSVKSCPWYFDLPETKADSYVIVISSVSYGKKLQIVLSPTKPRNLKK